MPGFQFKVYFNVCVMILAILSIRTHAVLAVPLTSEIFLHFKAWESQSNIVIL